MLDNDALDFDAIDFKNADPLELNTRAIDTAESALNIPKLIDAEDVTNKPEELSLILYISYFKEVGDELMKKSQTGLEDDSTKEKIVHVRMRQIDLPYLVCLFFIQVN